MARRARILRFGLWLVFGAPLLVAGVAWCAAALAIDGPWSEAMNRLAALLFAIVALACRFAVRPRVVGAPLCWALILGVIVWWNTIEPRNDRDWLPDVARTPTATFDGDLVTIHNVRNFDYRSETEYDERWETRTIDLSKLQGADLFLSYWGSPHIAHTIASWDFADDGHLAISIETRKEKGEEYSAVLGFFRQFELYYVVADERDLVGLRTDYRNEDVYLYRMKMPVAQARDLLVDYLQEASHLAEHPRWYNALTHNCTTTIRNHMQNIGVRNPLRWQLLANGHLPELAYETGAIDTSLPLDEMIRRSYVSEVAKALPPGSDYSTGIRANVPNPRSASN